MTKSFATPSPNTLSPRILALKPRQVLLLKPEMALKESADGDGTKLTLKPDQKALLHRLIGQYFNQSGFSKTVKKFVSEAKIEKEDLVDGSISLEEIFREHLENSNRGGKNSSRDEIEEINGKSKKDLGNESLADERAGEKKKKKKQNKIDVIEEASKETTDNISNDNEKKHKDKKRKGKSGLKSVDDVKPEGQGEGESFENKGDSDEEGKPKHKKKKKKDNESKQEPDVTKAENVNGAIENEGDKLKSKKRKSDNQASNENESEKASKKQKRLEGEENNEQAVDNKKNEENNVDGFQKTPEKQPDDQDDGNLGQSGAISATEKSAKKMQNGSKEPKKPFQRVKVEEVVFTDERLQDNSYWAKGGAETGYGAKAQEVLGQVRGRDFRHEKTKKKRGSYRGGMIDLQTHSVKFDNTDDE